MRRYYVAKTKGGDLQMRSEDRRPLVERVELYQTKEAACQAYQESLNARFEQHKLDGEAIRKAIHLDQYKLHELMRDLA